MKLLWGGVVDGVHCVLVVICMLGLVGAACVYLRECLLLEMLVGMLRIMDNEWVGDWNVGVGWG